MLYFLYITYENIDSKELQSAAEMFIYLNVCPGNLDGESLQTSDMEFWFQTWFSYYKRLFINQPADQIILAQNRMIKSDLKKGHNY